ncbi:bcl-2-like protein 15 [Ornithorhynchus anatinus]|uniref:bcl-2-like protein 15 n=1 Tax=Ornithorhynchus anatinus TaxID=9258 RepID=UPI0010A87D81|nr:bcl-2-like protein 15 [Ornithorhynchus anatinus]
MKCSWTFEEQTDLTVDSLLSDFRGLTVWASNCGSNSGMSQIQVAAVLRDTVQSSNKAWYTQDASLAYRKAFLAVLVKMPEVMVCTRSDMATQVAAPIKDTINRNSVLREYIQGQGSCFFALE